MRRMAVAKTHFITRPIQSEMKQFNGLRACRFFYGIRQDIWVLKSKVLKKSKSREKSHMTHFWHIWARWHNVHIWAILGTFCTFAGHIGYIWPLGTLVNSGQFRHSVMSDLKLTNHWLNSTRKRRGRGSSWAAQYIWSSWPNEKLFSMTSLHW